MVAVLIQALFSFFGIYILYRNLSALLSLSVVARLFLVAILIFPFFPPIEVANNLTSEGITYALYLLAFSFACDFLFKNEPRKLWHFSFVFLALTLTRGQFVLFPILLVFLYFLKNRFQIFRKVHLTAILTLLLLPVVAGLLDSTYHALTHGYFVKTPYTFVNAVTLPLFVSQEGDAALFHNADTRVLFEKSYARIDSLGLLSSEVAGGAMDKYMVFHEYFPVICNQNLHAQGKTYFIKKYGVPHLNFIQTELAAKEMFLTLVPQNFKKWGTLYLSGIVHGFQWVFILIFVLFVAVYSLWKTIVSFSTPWAFMSLASLLLLSNAFIVGIASHSIMRYLFYNYFLGFLLLILFFKKTTNRI